MTDAVVIAVLWLAFAATHVWLSSSRLRPRLVSRVGPQPFLGLYSALALAIFVPLVWVYFANKHAGPFLWYLGNIGFVRWLGYAGMAFALALLIGGLFTPSPASIAGDSGTAAPRGLLRVTRHPTLMALGLYGLVHLLVARIHAADLAFFAGFPLFVLIGARHQDQRKLASGNEAFRSFHAATSFLPFGGPGAFQGLREGLLPLALGVGAAIGLRAVHPAWFGGL